MKRSIWNHGVGADGSPFTNQYAEWFQRGIRNRCFVPCPFRHSFYSHSWLPNALELSDPLTILHPKSPICLAGAIS